MTKTVLVFPHQLFEENALIAKGDTVILIEDSLFFGDKHYPTSFHKQKLMLHRASMKHYATRLEQHCDVQYIDYHPDKTLKDVLTEISHKHSELHFYDPVDFMLEKRLERAAQKHKLSLERHSSPMFLNTETDNEVYFSKNRWFMASFYKHQRKELAVLLHEDTKPIGGKWSFDEENRKKLPKNRIPQVPDLPFIPWDETLTKAKNYVEKNFLNNHGSLHKAYYPYTHEQAKNWLESFLTERFASFGPYEDAIVENQNWLYHSVLTPMLNTGLLTPQYVLSRVLEFAAEENTPLASLEGFIRQLIGWREFIRAAYCEYSVSLRTSNHWQHKKPMPKAFYTANTTIDPIDNTLARVLETGYCHHIERLMVLGGFMFLCEIHPQAIYKWFSELFIDSYDWVMVPNVFAMSQNSANGLITTKPYFSGSNYIRKMSHYKQGDWSDLWDALYWRFIFKHKDHLKNNPRWAMMTRQADKMPKEKAQQHQVLAEQFLSNLH